MFGRMRKEQFLIEEADVSDVVKELLPGLEPCLVPRWIQSIEDEYLCDVVADQEF
jgi:hypothetical protein